MNIFLALLIGWAITRVQFVICAVIWPGLENPNAGYGAIDGTNKRTTLAPACYRVLLPWIVWVIEKVFPKATKKRLVTYEVISTVLNSLAVFGVASGWGIEVALLTSALLVLTYKYDYWDWAPELAGFGMAMSGDLTLAISGGFVAGLSRETAAMIPLVYFMRTWDFMGTLYVSLAVLIPMVFVRLFVGKRNLHCGRFAFMVNFEDVKEMLKYYPFYLKDTFSSIVITILAVVAVAQLPTAWPVPIVILIMGWLMARVEEPRVFSVCLPWIAAFLLGA